MSRYYRTTHPLSVCSVQMRKTAPLRTLGAEPGLGQPWIAKTVVAPASWTVSLHTEKTGRGHHVHNAESLGLQKGSALSETPLCVQGLRRAFS